MCDDADVDLSEAYRKRQRAWRIARICQRAAARHLLRVDRYAFGPYVFDGDQIQGIWQFWRYHVDGALPAGQLLTDYAFAYHSPPAHSAWMATLSTFLEPVQAAAGAAKVVLVESGAP